jgi:hypothetical protein
MEARHTVPVQNDELLAASFIAVLIPLRHAPVSEVQVEFVLMTANAAPACEAALAVILTNIPAPRSVTPSIITKNNGAKIAVSTAAVPLGFRRNCLSIFVTDY